MEIIQDKNYLHVPELRKIAVENALAASFPDETYEIYKEYILEEAKEATDRKKYKNVCKMIKNFYEAGAKAEAIAMIDQLSGMIHDVMLC